VPPADQAGDGRDGGQDRRRLQEGEALPPEAKTLHDAGKHAESVAKADEAAKAINLTLKKK
jgi:hypothetical protein